jgi:hypothetical protein
MGMMTKFLTAGALAAAMTAGAAQAATLDLDTSGGVDVVLPGTFDPAPVILGLAPGVTVKNYSGNFTGGLTVSGPAKITFTYLGKEAGFSNSAMELVVGTGILTDAATNASISFVQMTSGIVEFMFKTSGFSGANGEIVNGAGSSNRALDMAFKKISDTSYFALFGDGGGNNDDDYDDYVMRVDVSPVPVPAAGFLLIGALGGLVALRRRKTA